MSSSTSLSAKALDSLLSQAPVDGGTIRVSLVTSQLGGEPITWERDGASVIVAIHRQEDSRERG